MDTDIQREIRNIINEIERKSTDGDYIYRGEPEKHEEEPHCGKVSSSLWREYGVETEGFDIDYVQKEILNKVKKHIGHPQQEFVADLAEAGGRTSQTELELLTEIQHYGGKTNLIDFTTDYLIALFFACDGEHNKDGRVILQNIEKINNMINHPWNPRHRVIVQKSVFVSPPEGFIEPSEDDIVTIPAHLKRYLLEHLRKYHGVTTETIYNDLHGFIKHQYRHQSAYTEFYKGFSHQDRGNKTKTLEEKHKEYKKSIEHYDKSIELNPDVGSSYCNRGEALLHLRKWEEAKADLITAKEMGTDIISSFCNEYTDVTDFERANGFDIPDEIAKLLTPTQS